MKQYRPQQHGIVVKKQHGQNFLREAWVLDRIIDHAKIPAGASVLEIGCGDGALTRALLTTKLGQLLIYEIDPEWARHVAKTVKDSRLTIKLENILDIHAEAVLKDSAPWMLVANLPYHITFPILRIIAANPTIFVGGVFMVQEEVAQKLVAKTGRSYGYVSIFFQRYWHLELKEKIGPSAFFPPPKVDSRLVHFRIRDTIQTIPDEVGFWKFVKACFHQPRRTLKNNLESYHYDMSRLSEDILGLRAQQIEKDQLLEIWRILSAP